MKAYDVRAFQKVKQGTVYSLTDFLVKNCQVRIRNIMAIEAAFIFAWSEEDGTVFISLFY